MKYNSLALLIKGISCHFSVRNIKYYTDFSPHVISRDWTKVLTSWTISTILYSIKLKPTTAKENWLFVFIGNCKQMKQKGL